MMLADPALVQASAEVVVKRFISEGAVHVFVYFEKNVVLLNKQIYKIIKTNK
jgi:hypothetical protein